MRSTLILLLAVLGGCAGGVAMPGGGLDDPANPAAPAGDTPAVSQTLTVRDRPATMPAEAGKKPEGGHQHHAH